MSRRRLFLAMTAWLGLAWTSPAQETPAAAANPAAETRAETPAEARENAPALADDDTRVAVLGYHDFSPTLPETAMRIRTEKFRKQLEVIRQLGITVISLEEFIAWKQGRKDLPERCVLLTFDDGWRSVHTDAFPILREMGMPFTLYLYKNYVDGGGKALTTAMVQEMMKHGASIGSHSVSHPFPSAVKAQEKKGPHPYDAFLRRELGESKRFLESRFGTSVGTYAYPGGFHTPELIPLAEEFGYEFLFTVQPGKVKRSMPNHLLPRYMILGNHDRIFEYATAFRDASGAPAASLPDGAIAGLTQSTPQPVSPDAGVIISSRLPRIAVDLSAVPDLDPESLVMRVSGFGQVPARFDADSGAFSWQVNRRLRQPICQVRVTWKDRNGKALETPLAWSFQIDLQAAYMPEES